jgi:hypothetical protein
MTEQLPAIINRAKIVADAHAHIVPALIAVAGERASLRFLEFFAANIRNPHTRRASVAAFMTWCEDNGVTSITAVQPPHVSAWIEQQTREHAAPTANLRLAALRHLFDWLVTGPGDAGEPGGTGARTISYREGGQDAGAGTGGSARADRRHRDHDAGRLT